MHRARELRLFPPQAYAQCFGKQIVITVQTPLGVQRHQKEIRPLDSIKQGRARSTAGDRITQRHAQTIQQRCL